MFEYEWDSEKALSNIQKHGISFADAVAVFADEMALTVEDEFAHEERFLILGMDAFRRHLVVVFTWRGEHHIRIISARRATRRERQQYEG